RKNVDDSAIGIQFQTDRKRKINVLAYLLGGLQRFGGSVHVGKPITSRFDATEWRAIGSSPMNACFEETFPVIRRNAVQSLSQALERVRSYFGRTTGAAVKGAAEVVERLAALGLFADHCVGFEPNQQPFFIKIDAATRRLPVVSGLVQQLGGDGCIC